MWCASLQTSDVVLEFGNLLEFLFSWFGLRLELWGLAASLLRIRTHEECVILWLQSCDLWSFESPRNRIGSDMFSAESPTSSCCCCCSTLGTRASRCSAFLQASPLNVITLCALCCCKFLNFTSSDSITCGFRCQLAGRLVLIGIGGPRGEGAIWGSNPRPKRAVASDLIKTGVLWFTRW